MYFYSKKSRNKVIHTDKCFHILSTVIDDIGSFETLHEAYDEGYRLCKCCNPIEKRYKQEQGDILKMSADYGLSVRCRRYISVLSVASMWLIAHDGDKNLVLYHKNEFKRAGDEFNPICGYHLQRDAKANKIVDYLEYIIEHDYFRMLHPVQAPNKKKTSPPKKGTRRYRSEQRRNEKKERKQAIRNVLNLIDSLGTKPSVSRIVV